MEYIILRDGMYNNQQISKQYLLFKYCKQVRVTVLLGNYVDQSNVKKNCIIIQYPFRITYNLFLILWRITDGCLQHDIS